MHFLEQRILNKFKKEPLREISTTEIVRAAFPEKYITIIRDINDELSDKKTVLQAKREKGQLHRKVLYHLNKLVKEDILKVSSIKGKGEKYFSLSIDQGELIIEKKHKKIIITKPSISTSLLDEYEAKKIIQKFDSDTWINKLNCILLESTEQEGINKFYDLIYNCFSEINDALGLNNFEHIIQNNSNEELEDFLNKLSIDTKDHERFLSIIINTKNIEDEKKIIQFIKFFAKKKPKNIAFIFKTDSKELKKHTNIFEEAIREFSKQEIKLNLHNRKIHNAPVIIGKAGTYTLNEKEWEGYEQNIRGKTKGLVLSNTSIAVDLYRFFRETQSSKQFRDLIMRIAKTILKVNSTQRKKSNEYFKRLNEMNKPHTKKFFIYSKNYIRFWNYNLADEKQAHLIELLASSKQEINKFCSTEETIYKSCGIPINFKISFSTVFKKFSPNLSERIYSKTTIKKFKDFHSNEIMNMITNKEKLARIFGCGDRTRFFRRGIFTPNEVIKEFVFLMNTHELPLITYDFKELRGEIKLTSFIE